MPSLYVTEPGALLEKEAGRLLVTRDDAGCCWPCRPRASSRS